MRWEETNAALPLIRMQREQKDMERPVVRPRMLGILILLAIVSAISVLAVMLFSGNLRPNSGEPTPHPTLSESKDMADYGYLNYLDRLKSGGYNKSTRSNRSGGGGRFGEATGASRSSSAAPRSTATAAPARTATGGSFGSSRTSRSQGGSFGGGTPPVRANPPVRNAPVAPPRPPGGTNMRAAVAPVAPAPSGGATWNYDSVTPSATGSYGGAPAASLATDPSAMMSDEEYLPTDSIYVSEAAGINADVQALLDTLKRNRAGYDIDFGKALRNLGWDPGSQDFANPGQGQWRQQDMTGAYGAAYNNQQNDFAGRGMLTSSFYGDALEDLLSSFDTQRNDMFSGRQRQMDDWTAEETQAQTQQRQGLDRARAAALARRAAGLQLTGF